MSTKGNSNEDEELSDLLDCALKDFDKPVDLKKKLEKGEKDEDQLKFEQTSDQLSDSSSNKYWDSTKFKEALHNLLSDDKDLKDELDLFSESTQQHGALKDFDKPVDLKTKLEKREKDEGQLNFEQTSDQLSDSSSNKCWDSSKFKEALHSLLNDDKDLKDELDLFSESTQQQVEADEDVAASLQNTLKGLAENAENIFDSSTEDMAQLLENIAKNSGNFSDEGISDILPLMQDVMQKLLSKELLYPALKDIVNKYPKWLEEKHGVLQDEEFQCYSKQYELMKQVCDEFEMEEDGSSTSQKERFERVMALMQKLQDCGHPPKELIGEMAPEIEFDGKGNPKIPGLQGDQCCIM